MWPTLILPLLALLSAVRGVPTATPAPPASGTVNHGHRRLEHSHDEKEKCSCAQAEPDHPFTIDCANAQAIRDATTTLETTRRGARAYSPLRSRGLYCLLGAATPAPLVEHADIWGKCEWGFGRT